MNKCWKSPVLIFSYIFDNWPVLMTVISTDVAHTCGQVRWYPVTSSCSLWLPPTNHPSLCSAEGEPASWACPSVSHCSPVPLWSGLLSLKQSVVIRPCLKGEPALCLRSPSAMSVPLVRDSCRPGAIRSQAEGGMSLSSKSQTGQRREEKKKKKNTHKTRAQGRHAYTFCTSVIIIHCVLIIAPKKHVATFKTSSYFKMTADI